MLFEKNDAICLSGQVFSYELYQYLMGRFKEAFSYSSLTIEEAFKELEHFDMIIKSSMNDLGYEIYDCLGSREKKQITDIVHQIIVFKGSRFGVFPDKLTGDQKQIDKLYEQYFSYFEPYVYSFLRFDADGNFDKVATFNFMDTLFYNLPQRETAYKRAYNMQKDNLDAFDYAMSLKDLSIRDVIQINNMVNDSDPDKVLGFKKTNNQIIGASFTPVDKKDVPFELQKLFAEYKDDEETMYMLLDPNEPGISNQERFRRIGKIIHREAEFHIRFERIHPFNDGNGRTGRIILNHHLIRQGVAPVIISDAMSEEYRRCINENDADGLARLLFYSSSLQITNWVSEKKARPVIRRKDIHPDNKQLAELVGYDDMTDDGDNKGKLFGKNCFF